MYVISHNVGPFGSSVGDNGLLTRGPSQTCNMSAMVTNWATFVKSLHLEGEDSKVYPQTKTREKGWASSSVRFIQETH